jgi:hypothetical protein
MGSAATAPTTEQPPAWAWEGTYPGIVSQARQVRAALRSLLAGCPAAEDVLLVVSELAANAIAHSHSGLPGGTFTVRLDHTCGDHIRAEVEDQGSPWDGDLTACTRQPHGLYLVTALSAACGTGHGPGCSRRVWARIDDRAGPGQAAAARLARVLEEYPAWSVFWDKACGVWRAAEDDPGSALHAESSDLDTVISYITAHS